MKNRHKFPESHGLWNKMRREYQCWQDMKQRCTNITNPSYRKEYLKYHGITQ